MDKKYHKQIATEHLVKLYSSVGWLAYTRAPELLVKAIANSTYVVSAWEKEELIALARCISDDISIMYLQDILVAPSYQRQGIGRSLLEDCVERFKHVRQKVLLTDSSPGQIIFYETLGFERVSNYKGGALNAFVRIEDQT